MTFFKGENEYLREFDVYYSFATEDGAIQDNGELKKVSVVAENSDKAIVYVSHSVEMRGLVPLYVGVDYVKFTEEEIAEILKQKMDGV